MARTLLMVGAGVMGRGYLTAAQRLGLRVVLVDLPAHRATHAPVADAFHECPDPADETWLRAALEAAAGCRPDGVLAFSEPQVLAASWLQDSLGLPGPSLRAAQASRNKAVQRVLLQRAGIGQPGFHLAGESAAVLAWARARYPVVVKTLRQAGSAGVRLVKSEAQLSEVLSRRWPPEPVLVEEYVAAPEYSWEGLVQHGQVRFGNYTRKQTSGPPEFVELGHELPARFSAAQQELLDTMTAGVVAALGIDSALVHLEFRFDGTRAFVMETAVRTPGDYLMDLLGLAYGHDVFASTIQLAVGDPVAVPGPAFRQAAVGFLTSPPGVVQAIDGADAAQQVPGVVAVDIEKQPGDSVGRLRSSEDRIGCVLAAGADGDPAQAVATALARIRVSVTAAEPARVPVAA